MSRAPLECLCHHAERFPSIGTEKTGQSYQLNNHYQELDICHTWYKACEWLRIGTVRRMLVESLDRQSQVRSFMSSFVEEKT